MNDETFYHLIVEFKSLHEQALVLADQIADEAIKRKRSFHVDGVDIRYRVAGKDEAVTIEVSGERAPLATTGRIM